MKKAISIILKVFLVILVLFLLAAGGVFYYVYRTVNNFDEYQDKFVDYQSELAQYEGSRFEDFIFYDKDNNLFTYEVPRAYIYKIINAESMKEYLALPEELEITEVGVEPDLHNMKAKIYLGIRYKSLAHCVLEIDTDLVLSDNAKRLEMRFNDYYLINDKVMEAAKDYISFEKGGLMFVHNFPTFVVYYQMPDYKPEYVYDLKYDGKNIFATYDIKAALTKYKEEEYDKNSLEEKLEAVWLEVRQSGIKHN